MKLKSFLLASLCFCNLYGSLAQNPVMTTSAKDRITPISIANELKNEAKFKHIKVQNIGPTIMSGRVTDIEVNPSDATEFYVAYASGGLWHTVNNGTTFTPIFDKESVMTIGDITLNWDNRTIYVGTGEVNSSRSSYAGNGIYKSTTNGKEWTHLGLEETHHIGRICIDHNNSQHILVAALGHLYSPNPERGLFMSEDGGKTWIHTLYVNENTGGIDLIQDPNHDNTWYAATWTRERRAWNFVESGDGSGIYKSTDGGKSWTLLTTSANGFPTGEGVGRIGLDISTENGKSVLYAILDNYNRRPKETDHKDKNEYTKDDFKTMTKDQFSQLDDKLLGDFLKANGFDEKKYSAEKVKEMVAKGDINPDAIVAYLEDANALLFDTEVIGTEVYISKDNGSSFTKTHSDYIDGVFSSYGYYFAQIVSEPHNPAVVYIMGVPILRSDDYGQTWKDVNGDNVHSDHHTLWINPANPRHIINGNDGGLNISYDKGESWIKCNAPSVGQFYAINVDYEKNYNVYGGLQDNGVWFGPNSYEASTRWHQSGQYPYKSIMGGDGMQVQIDRRDNETVYTGFQFGNYFRINKNTGERAYITPKHELGERPYRWNWQTPILLSHHNQDILYMGSNFLMRSMDKGESFKTISPDLTHGGSKGDVPYGTLTTISESRQNFGKILIGTDDGRIQLTRDGGYSWQDVSRDLPPHLWVSRVAISRHDDKVLYASLNGYRWDDFNPYLFVSTDDGSTWKNISGGLPMEPINVIIEDDSQANIIYVGTDHGLYISLDKGNTFGILAADMPRVPIHDLVIQESAQDLLIGTHGRSIYKLNLTDLRKVCKEGTDNIYVSTTKKTKYRSNWGRKRNIYSAPNSPEWEYQIYCPSATKATMSISTEDGKTNLFTESIDLREGLATYKYNLQVDNKMSSNYSKILKSAKDPKILEKSEDEHYYLMPGTYIITITANNTTATDSFEIVE